MARTDRVKPPADDRAQHAVDFVNALRHTKGMYAGQLFALRDWQERIIRQLFSTRKDGRRQYRTCLLMLPRKNGKSEICAALALYGLLGDREPGAEVYSAAADRDQASLVFNVAADMIRQEPELSVQCEIIESQKRIVHRRSGSIYRAISAEAYSKHGFNASMVIYDELHAAPNRELWDVLATSQGARAQPLMIAISTAGYDRHSILYELYSHAKRVQQDPTLDPTFLPVIYEAPKDADWTDESVWDACNPALGDFRSLEDMRILAQRAKAIPAQENTFRRLYLNQWTEQAERWIPLALWKACERPLNYSEMKGRPCYVGLDLSSTRDLTALVAVFPDPSGGFDILPCAFVPKDTMKERVQRDRVPYDLWAEQGYLELTNGSTTDYEAVRAKLKQWNVLYDVREVAYDPWNATDLVKRLEEQDGLPCVQMRQGYASLSAPTKSLEKAILSGTARHDGHPVLANHIDTVAVETDPAGNIKPSKKASTDRIDLVVALIMAMDCMNRNAANKPKSYDVFIVGGRA